MKEYSQLQYALSYIKLEFAVFPLKPRSKIPLTKNGFKDASKDLKQVKNWCSFEKNPRTYNAHSQK